MIFASFQFVFVFLPLCLISVFLAAKYFGGELARIVLLVASAIFYCSWNPVDGILVAFSIVLNFMVGERIRLAHEQSNKQAAYRWMLSAVACNLFLLVIFKYSNLIFQTVNDGLGTQLTLWNLVLPLGISFFTVQQIEYVVDSYRKQKPTQRLQDDALLVLFFPHLIAGPSMLAYDRRVAAFNCIATAEPVETGMHQRQPAALDQIDDN